MNESDRESFSRRYGFSSKQREITIRYEAPEELRGAILQIAIETGLTPSPLRQIICRVLRTLPDRYNWSEYPNIWDEVQGEILSCNWFKVYDIAEAIYRDQSQGNPIEFEKLLNEYFIENGIGWQMEDGKIIARGSESFETTIHEAVEILENSGRPTASNEIHEAINDLSRRPEPDTTGAIQHGMAALECVARDICGDSNATLGQILNRYSDRLNLPRPLDEALTKLWGYSSNMARHMREGNTIDYIEAELVVGTACVIATYLSKKNR